MVLYVNSGPAAEGPEISRPATPDSEIAGSSSSSSSLPEVSMALVEVPVNNSQELDDTASADLPQFRKRRRVDSMDGPAFRTDAFGNNQAGPSSMIGTGYSAIPPIDRSMDEAGLPSTIARDDTFYIEDGSCVLLVENTLFNVHRSIMSKDNSSFRSMFSLPQGNNHAEGSSDRNPIILEGDTASEFRHFLSALYALPLELQTMASPKKDLTPLMDVTRISHKYSFTSVETWALDAIQEYVNRKPSPILKSIPAPTVYSYSNDPAASRSTSSSIKAAEGELGTHQLTRLVRLAQICNHEKLLHSMIELLRHLMSSSLQYAYLAMTLADELDIRALRGSAYLEVMQKAVVVKKGNFTLRTEDEAVPGTPNPEADVSSRGAGPPGTREGDVDEEGRLVISQAQQLRLLSGYYRLTRTWENLRNNPPAFDHSPSCGATWHQHGCTQSWLEFWKDKTRTDAVLSLGLADVIGRLRQVLKDFDRWGSATYMHHDCKTAARKKLSEAIMVVEDALPDYFSEGDD